MPAAARAHTPAGAAAFAKFFIQTVDWAYATTSPAYMRHYFEDSCVICIGLANDIADVARKRWSYVGDRLTVTRVVVSPNVESEATVDVALDITAVAVINAHGDTESGNPPIRGYREQVVAAWDSGRWVVKNVVPLR